MVEREEHSGIRFSHNSSYTVRFTGSILKSQNFILASLDANYWLPFSQGCNSRMGACSDYLFIDKFMLCNNLFFLKP